MKTCHLPGYLEATNVQLKPYCRQIMTICETNRPKYYKFFGICILVFGLLLTGCKNSSPTNTTDDDQKQEQPDPNTSSKEVGPDGGTLSSSDNLVTLDIPAGALGSNETITISLIEAEDLGSEFNDVTSEIGIDKAYELGPDGLTFEQPITVSFASNQTVTQEGDSVVIAPAALLTSDGGETVGLDSLRMVVDEESGEVTLAGELSHFSPLVKTDEWERVTFIVEKVPNMLAVNQTFTVEAHIISYPNPHQEGVYTDFSILPVKADFSPAKQEMTLLSEQATSQSSFKYTCAETGVGTFKAQGSARINQRSLSSLTVVIPLQIQKDVTCVEAQEPGTIYVSADNGNDETGTGSQSQPYASLMKAIEGAEPGNTVKVESGTYSAAKTGESWDYPIGGIIIEAADPEGPPPILDGTGNESFTGIHAFESTPKSLASAEDYPTVLRNLVIKNFDQPGAATMVFQTGSVTLQNVTVENSGGVVANGTAQVQAEGNTFTNTYVSVFGDATLNIVGSVFTQAGVSAGDNGLLYLEEAQISQAGVTGNGNAVLTILNSSITESTADGVRVDENASLTMTGGSITNATGTADNFGFVTGGDGILFWSGGNLTIDGVEISGNYRNGVYFRSGGMLTVRNSVVTNNGNVDEDNNYGINLVGPDADLSTVDLGTDADPGNNTFSGNTNYQLYDGRYNADPGTANVVNAAGNNWGEGVTPPTGIKTGPASEGDLWLIFGTGYQIDFGGD